MANPTDTGGRAQHSCAQDALATLGLAALPPHVREEIESAPTLAAKLRALLAAHSRERPLELSAAELAELFVPHHRDGERSVRRALSFVRFTYAAQYREKERRHRRTFAAPGRWIERECQGVVAYPGSLSDQVSVASGSRKAIATRARDARPHASRSQRTRIRARRLDLPPLPPELTGNEGGVFDAIRTRHGDKGVRAVVRDLARLAQYREHPLEADRALRTLAERESDTPLRLFRHLFNRACDGDLLIDEAAEVAATREAELAERMKDPDYAARAEVEGRRREPPHPLRARLNGVRDRLAITARGNPRRAELEAEAAALEREVAKLPQPTEHAVWAAETGPPTGRMVRIPGTTQALVVHERAPPVPPGIPELDDERCAALDRDEVPP